MYTPFYTKAYKWIHRLILIQSVDGTYTHMCTNTYRHLDMFTILVHMSVHMTEIPKEISTNQTKLCFLIMKATNSIRVQLWNFILLFPHSATTGQCLLCAGHWAGTERDITVNAALTWRDLQAIYSGSTGKSNVSPRCGREFMGELWPTRWNGGSY